MFGHTLADFQLTQKKIGEMALAIDASALLVYRAAGPDQGRAARARHARGPDGQKLHATEAAQRVIDGAVQLFGGLGVVGGMWWWSGCTAAIRSALRIYEGASEVLELIIGARTLEAARRAAFVNEALPPVHARICRCSRCAFGALGRWLAGACQLAAVLGTLVFVALVAMSIVSISGRKLFPAPVRAMSNCCSCARPLRPRPFAWCHLNHGDVKIDFFTERLPERAVHASTPWARRWWRPSALLLAWRTGAGVSARGRRDHQRSRPAVVGGAGADAAGLRAAGAGLGSISRRRASVKRMRP